MCIIVPLIKPSRCVGHWNPQRSMREVIILSRLSELQKLFIDSLHPFCSHSSRQRQTKVKKKAILRASLGGVLHKKNPVSEKAGKLSGLTSLRESPRDIWSSISFCSSLRAPIDCWFLAKSESSFSPASSKYLVKCSLLRLFAGNNSWKEWNV